MIIRTMSLFENSQSSLQVRRWIHIVLYAVVTAPFLLAAYLYWMSCFVKITWITFDFPCQKRTGKNCERKKIMLWRQWGVKRDGHMTQQGTCIPHTGGNDVWCHGRRTGGGGAKNPMEFEFFTKKGNVFSFEWKKANFTILAPPGKIFEKPLVPPLEKILPTPMCDATSTNYLWARND